METDLRLLEVHLRDGVDARRWMAGAAERSGQRHREAAGLGGGDELLGIGARPLLEAGREGILTVERTGPELHRPLAALQISLPHSFSVANRHTTFLSSTAGQEGPRGTYPPRSA